MMLNLIWLMIFCTIGYLFGSICSAIVISRLFDLPDPRQSGSKNPGATNVLRLAGKKYAIMVLVGDMLKGLIPVLIAHLFDASPTILGFTALAAVLGHIYPLFFSFKGGKGVATALGAMFGLHFMMGVILLSIWLLIAKFFRYSSLASIITFLLAPIFSIIFFRASEIFIPLILITIYIIYQHRDNITRLIAGTEPKISLKKDNLEGIAEEVIIDGSSASLKDAAVSEVLLDETPVIIVEKTAKPKKPAVRKSRGAATKTTKTKPVVDDDITKPKPKAKPLAKTESEAVKPVKRKAPKPKPSADKSI